MQIEDVMKRVEFAGQRFLTLTVSHCCISWSWLWRHEPVFHKGKMIVYFCLCFYYNKKIHVTQ